MTTLTEFTASLTTFLDTQETILTDLQGDIKFLTDKITELQNAGGLTPEQQAAVDALQARLQPLQAKFQALDDLTPPVAPEQPPVG